MWQTLTLLAGMLAAALGAPADDGFTPLFNGRDLTGWVVVGNPEGFRVEEGCLSSEGGKGGNWIRTEREYGNFILRLEWMLSQTGNSGVFIRSGSSSKEPGFEVQLLAPWTPHRDDLHCTGSIYGHVAVNPRPDETPLRWRTMEIACRWKQVSVRIDGVECTRADYDQVGSMKGLALRGYIGLQDSHTGPGEWVRFRNIEIRDLDREPAFLAESLSVADLQVRRLAYEAAVRLGPSMIPALLDLLSGDNAVAAHAADLALSRIVAQATAPGANDQAEAVQEMLRARLRGPGGLDDRARVAAAQLLSIAGQDNRPTVYALQQALLPGGKVAEAALLALQRIPGRRVTEALLGVLPRVPSERQPAVLLALSSRPDPRALAELGARAQKGPQEVRLAALQALGNLGLLEAVPILERVALSSNPGCRRAAVQALLAIADAPATPPRTRLDLIHRAEELQALESE